MATFTLRPYPRLWLVALLGAVLVAAGCGGSGVLSLDPVASAADKTLDKGSAHFNLSIRITDPQSGQAMALTGSGSFNNADQSAELTMDVPQLGTIATRLIYPVMYLQLNGVPGVPTDKWVKIDLQKALKQAGVDLQQALAGGNQSPSDALAQLRGSKDAKKLGTETIDGVKTTHYRAKVDLDKALSRATPKQRRALKDLLRSAKAQGYDAVPKAADVWVGDDGLVRRFTEQLGNVGTMTMSFSDYGAPVHVDAPPAADTIDIAQLLGGG